MQPLALGAIADLIMVLDADHVGGSGHACAAGAARASTPELEGLALKDKAVRERAGNLLRLAKILVIAFALAGKKRVDGVMEIVTPDGVQTIAAGFCGDAPSCASFSSVSAITQTWRPSSAASAATSL